jgi:hypothetical protein
MAPEINEDQQYAFCRSISKGVRDEVHYSDICIPFRVMSQLNDHGRIVYSFLRICKCKMKKQLPDRQYLIQENAIVDVPQDGVDVHLKESCEYSTTKGIVNGKSSWKFTLDCKCFSRTKRGRAVDESDRVPY